MADGSGLQRDHALTGACEAPPLPHRHVAGAAEEASQKLPAIQQNEVANDVTADAEAAAPDIAGEVHTACAAGAPLPPCCTCRSCHH